MDSQIDFDVNESLKQYLSDPASIPTPEADAALVDCETEPDSFTPALINSVLDPIVDAIAESPEALAQSSTFHSIQFLLKCAPTSPLPSPESERSSLRNPDPNFFTICRSSSLCPPQALTKILDTVVSGFSSQVDTVHNELEANENEAFQQYKQLLEAYSFLLQWTIAAVETKATEKSASTSASAIRGRGGKGGRSKAAKDSWDASPQLQAALDVMSKALKLRLSRLFPTSSERDTFVSLSTRAAYLIIENEARVKSMAIRMHSFKVICIAVKHHGHAYGMWVNLILRCETLKLTYLFRRADFHHSKPFVL